MMERTGLTTRNVALAAIFAALYYVINIFTVNVSAPGVSQVTISVAALIATVFGLVLGPYLGTFAAFLGAFVAWTLPPSGMSPMGLPFLLSPPLNAFVSGSIFYKKWKMGFVAFLVLIVAFFFTPPVQPLTENWVIAAAVVFDKFAALFLILPLVVFAKQFASSDKGLYAFYFLIGFIGNQVDNMWGTLAFSTTPVYNGIFGLQLIDVQAGFLISPFFYPALRLAQAAIVMFVAFALMRTLKGTPWVWKKENILSKYEKPVPSAAPATAQVAET